LRASSQKSVKKQNDKRIGLKQFIADIPYESKIRTQDLVSHFGYSSRQAQRDLTWLVVTGSLREIGARKNRFYVRASNSLLKESAARILNR